MIEPVVAKINEEACSGCRICNSLCPFQAIEFIADAEVSRIVDTLCKGCGTCVAACPAEAISGAHFSRKQVEAELAGLGEKASDLHLARRKERKNLTPVA